MATIEERLAVLEAKEEIRDLFNRYGFAADTGDAGAWSEVWAKDAVYERADASISGREAFFRSIDDENGAHKRDIEGRGSLHTTGPLMIEVAGDRAWAEGPALVWIKNQGGYSVYALSYNHWDLQKKDGRWEILKRIGRPVAPKNAQLVYQSWNRRGVQ
jgi:hypothetical protein